METYIGMILVKAKQMNRAQYNEYRNLVLPRDENGADEGYLVEAVDGEKPNHPDHDGYISWYSKYVFEKLYKPCKHVGLDFGFALKALKNGIKIARSGWNGKGMWLSLSCDGSRQVAAEKFWSPHNAEFARQNGGTATVQPCITMKTADGSIQMGWSPSQADMLAEDWVIVE